MATVVKSVELPSEVRLSYVEQGDPAAVPVLLLHGLGDSWRSYDSPHAIANFEFEVALTYKRGQKTTR